MTKKLFIFLLLFYSNTSFSSDSVDINISTNNVEIPDRTILDIIYPKGGSYKGNAHKYDRTQTILLLKKAVIESDVGDVQDILNNIKLTCAEKNYLYSLATKVESYWDNVEDKQFFAPVYRKKVYSAHELNIATAIVASLGSVFAGKSLVQACLPQCLNFFHKIIRFQAIFTMPMFIYMVLWAQMTRTIRLANLQHTVEVTVFQQRAHKIDDIFFDIFIDSDPLDVCDNPGFYSPLNTETPRFDLCQKEDTSDLYKRPSLGLRATICGALATACFAGYMLFK